MSKHYMIIAILKQLLSSLEKFLDMMEKKKEKKKRSVHA